MKNFALFKTAIGLFLVTILNIALACPGGEPNSLVEVLEKIGPNRPRDFSFFYSQRQMEIRDSNGVALPGFPVPKAGLLEIASFRTSKNVSMYSSDGKFFGLLVQGFRYDYLTQENQGALFLFLWDTSKSAFHLNSQSKLIGVSLAKTVPFGVGIRRAEPFRTFEPKGLITAQTKFVVETLRFEDGRPEKYVVNLSVRASETDLQGQDRALTRWSISEMGENFPFTPVRFLKFSLPQH